MKGFGGTRGFAFLLTMMAMLPVLALLGLFGRKEKAKAIADSVDLDRSMSQATKVLAASRERAGGLTAQMGNPDVVKRAGGLSSERIVPQATKLGKETMRTVGQTAGDVGVKAGETAGIVAAELMEQMRRARETAPDKLIDLRKTAARRGSQLADILTKEMAPELKQRVSRMQAVTGGTATIAGRRITETGGQLIGQARPRIIDFVQRTQPSVSETMSKGRGKLAGLTTGLGLGLVGLAGGVAKSSQMRASQTLEDTAKATKSASRELAGTLFWLGVAGTILILVLYPKREDKERLWRQVQEYSQRIADLIQQARNE